MVVAKKSLGQNFLMHAQTAERIVGAARLPDDAVVLEIGPGTGMLTKSLLKVAGKVVAIEADDQLVPQLQETFAEEIAHGKLEIVHGDFRELDLNTLPQPYHVVANIPYYITGEIMRQLLTSTNKPQSMTLLVQKEVAERIARNNGKESLLSLSITAFGTPSYCFTVPRGAFRPAPNVDSAVLSIRNISGARFSSPEEEDWFFSVLRAGFAHKRKRLAKNLEVVSTGEAIKAAMEELHLSKDVRSEDVPVETWGELSRLLYTARGK